MALISIKSIRMGLAHMRIALRKARRRDRIMSLEELRAEYDVLTRRLMHMSGEEFARRVKADDLPQSPAVDYLRFVLSAAQKG